MRDNNPNCECKSGFTIFHKSYVVAFHGSLVYGRGGLVNDAVHLLVIVEYLRTLIYFGWELIFGSVTRWHSVKIH